MKLRTKKWVSGILSLAMLVSVSVATSNLFVNAEEVAAPQTAKFVNLDQTTTNAEWEGAYGKDGYIIPANVNNTWWKSTGFYSDMYEGNDGKTGIASTQNSDARNGTAYYNTAAVELKKDASITRWGYGASYFNGGAASKADTLLLPGTTDTYGQVDLKNAIGYYADMSIFFTKRTDDKQLVTVYISDLHNKNYGMNVDVYVYASHKMAYNKGNSDRTDCGVTTSTTNFYGNNYIANHSFTINKNNSDYNAYVTFELKGAGDFEIVVTGGQRGWTVPSIQGLFFDNAETSMSRSITLEENIAFNYYVTPDLLHTEYTMACTVNGQTKDIEGVEQADGRIKFTFAGITPQYLTANVTASVKAKNSNGDIEELLSVTESVKDYCMLLLSDETYSAYHTLAIDLLNYGAAAQTYTDTNIDDLANVALTESQTGTSFDETNIATASSKIENNDGKAVVFKGARLYFDNKVGVQIAFTAENITGLKAVITMGGKEVALDKIHSVQMGDNSVYAINFTNIMPYEYDTTFTVVIQDAEGNAVSGTLTYSVNGFIEKSHENALYQKLWCYGVSAKAIKEAQ